MPPGEPPAPAASGAHYGAPCPAPARRRLPQARTPGPRYPGRGSRDPAAVRSAPPGQVSRRGSRDFGPGLPTAKHTGGHRVRSTTRPGDPAVAGGAPIPAAPPPPRNSPERNPGPRRHFRRGLRNPGPAAHPCPRPSALVPGGIRSTPGRRTPGAERPLRTLCPVWDQGNGWSGRSSAPKA
ncbi:Uncharacterised protein [Amycolatopsis camponoti]|uniref:Uncharacterized protein n=1 Tax=Amycolatopsis camponoti TaxID=2606593 RepID=A0A6I8LNL9_9PSEU|nr:Uncharacterised protein [Amycolatopsis camponoti]